MDESVTKYFAESTPLSLTTEERVAGRLALQAKIALSLAEEEKIAARRALQHVVYADPSPAAAWSIFRLPLRLPTMALAVLLLLGASGGGLYAAESALPGDALYGVKIHVNEAIRAKLHVTPEDRARWAVVRLERRMNELRALEARGAAEADIDVAIGGRIEKAAADVETEVGALPAAAAERAAMRTAVNAAIGTDQDSLRRASRINRVLKALKERADGFDVPPEGTIVAPAPIIRANADANVEGPLHVDIGGAASVSIGDGASSVSASSVRSSSMPASSAPRSEARAASSVSVGAAASEPSADSDPLALPIVDAPIDVPEVDVPDVVDGLL
jgi:hypothetical protein